MRKRCTGVKARNSGGKWCTCLFTADGPDGLDSQLPTSWKSWFEREDRSSFAPEGRGRWRSLTFQDWDDEGDARALGVALTKEFGDAL